MSTSNPFPSLNLSAGGGSSSSTTFQSPNVIPSRSSSIGHHRDNSLNASQSPPPKSVLRPVPEASWLAAGSSSTDSTMTPANVPGGSGTVSPPPGPRSPDTVVAAGISCTAGAHTSALPQPLSSNPVVGASSSHQHAHSRSHSHTRSRSRKASIISNLNHTSFMAQMPTAPPVPPDPSRFGTDELPWGGKTWNEDKERILTGPFDYLFAHPGKDFRAQVINAFNAWLDVPEDSLEVITKAVGMLHTASLLIDDVEDSSLLRRSLPVAHSIFGTAQTINSANYVYFVALQELQRLKNPKAISIFAEELVHLHRGQGMDLFWRDTLTCPTEDDYLEMVGNKTGGLFRLGIKLMQAESRSLIDCVPLVNIIGLIFQIRDDYMNLSSPEYSHNKGLCEDLTEGKFSFPIIHSIRSDPTNFQLLNILKQKPTEQEVKRYAVTYMEGTGSFEYTKNVVHVLIERARKLVDEIDDGRGKSGGIQKMLDKMVV